MLILYCVALPFIHPNHFNFLFLKLIDSIHNILVNLIMSNSYNIYIGQEGKYKTQNNNRKTLLLLKLKFAIVACFDLIYSGPVYAVLLRHHSAISHLRHLLGPMNPLIAREISPTSLRAVYGTDIIRNAVHATQHQGVLKRECDAIFGNIRRTLIIFGPPAVNVVQYILSFGVF